jgi:hypothetical protein
MSVQANLIGGGEEMRETADPGFQSSIFIFESAIAFSKTDSTKTSGIAIVPERRASIPVVPIPRFVKALGSNQHGSACEKTVSSDARRAVSLTRVESSATQAAARPRLPDRAESFKAKADATRAGNRQA